MVIVGLTGGIGSGKTTVANMFESLGVPVYIADQEAKQLTNRSKVIRKKLSTLLGDEAYTEEGLNRAYVADKIFNDTALLKQVNAIIHPKVRQHFKRWVAKQNGPYCIKEAAILFESGGHEQCDLTVMVTAPKEIRIQRVMARDGVQRKDVEARMEHQWSDAKKLKLADYSIENSSLEETKKQVLQIHSKILAHQ
ncbi:MAG: dephospho-CoA kinase [Marinirhabdus sp.]|nr:dephospho-CoA kinase [Marinirhabdus sp.]